MQADKFLELAERFRKRECTGIASFLEFMSELEEGDRPTIFKLMFVKRLGIRPSTIEDPLNFFTTLHRVRAQNPPFIDEAIKLLDTTCREIAEMWEEAGRAIE